MAQIERAEFIFHSIKANDQVNYLCPIAHVELMWGTFCYTDDLEKLVRVVVKDY